MPSAWSLDIDLLAARVTDTGPLALLRAEALARCLLDPTLAPYYDVLYAMSKARVDWAWVLQAPVPEVAAWCEVALCRPRRAVTDN